MDNQKTWAVVALASVALICVTVALALRVPVTELVTVITILIVPVMGALLYGKVSKVESQTNGNNTAQAELIARMVSHLQVKDMTPPTLPPVEVKISDHSV